VGCKVNHSSLSSAEVKTTSARPTCLLGVDRAPFTLYVSLITYPKLFKRKVDHAGKLADVLRLVTSAVDVPDMFLFRGRHLLRLMSFVVLVCPHS
jgi:hypothetical protein